MDGADDGYSEIAAGPTARFVVAWKHDAPGGSTFAALIRPRGASSFGPPEQLRGDGRTRAAGGDDRSDLPGAPSWPGASAPRRSPAAQSAPRASWYRSGPAEARRVYRQGDVDDDALRDA